MADKFSIYAELLPNIRQVSIVASLPSPCDASTRALILSGGNRIHVSHGGDMRLLELPAVVSTGPSHDSVVLPVAPGGGCAASEAGPKASSQCVWRFPLPRRGSRSSARPPAVSTQSGEAPWEAVRIEAGAALACRSCGAVVVSGDRIAQWKDLPSANWAEMMEFWHCHKPDDDHDHGSAQPVQHGHHGSQGDREDPQRLGKGPKGKADEQALTSRGYGADSKIQAQRGIGFVDLATFLLAEDDCGGLIFSQSSFDCGQETPRLNSSNEVNFRHLNIFCAACRSNIGYYSYGSSAVTLLKWQVLIQMTTTEASSPPSIGQCLAAMLLSSVARSGSSKALVVPMSQVVATGSQTACGKALHIWILNSTIRFTSTMDASRQVPAIKLLYRVISEAEANKMMESMSSDAQDISLPEESLASIIQVLNRSNTVLPVSDREFQGWNVGLLERWEADTDL